MPQATSTIWMARRTEPRASSRVLPFSVVRMRGDLVGVLVEQRLVAVEDLHAIDDRHFAPLAGTPHARRAPRDRHRRRSAYGTCAITCARGRVGDRVQSGARGRLPTAPLT